MGVLQELDESGLQLVEDKACQNAKGAAYCLLMFHAKWCDNCKKLEPLLEQVANTLKKDHPNLTVAMLDVDNYSEEADYYAISMLPTVVLLSGGKAKRYNGSHTVESFVRFVNNIVRQPYR